MYYRAREHVRDTASVHVLIAELRDMSAFNDRLQDKNRCMLIRIEFLVLVCSIRMKM